MNGLIEKTQIAKSLGNEIVDFAASFENTAVPLEGISLALCALLVKGQGKYDAYNELQETLELIDVQLQVLALKNEPKEYKELGLGDTPSVEFVSDWVLAECRKNREIEPAYFMVSLTSALGRLIYATKNVERAKNHTFSFLERRLKWWIGEILTPRKKLD